MAMVANQDKRKITWTVAIYYYVAMLICLGVFFGGANLATHGFLRANSPDMAPYATCLPPPAPKVTDPAHISRAEKACRQAERNNQIRQGLFEVAQGLTMVVIASIVFAWYFQHTKKLELNFRKTE